MNKQLTFGRFWSLIVAYLILTITICVISLSIGAEKLNWDLVWEGVKNNTHNEDIEILVFLRVPRIILGFLAGGTLALVGCCFQVILRNPLATPYTLGITNGAALGAVLALAMPQIHMGIVGFSTVQIFALTGASLAMLIIYLFARQHQGLSMNVLLLAGVTLGIFCNAHIMLVRYLSKPDFLVAMDRWLMGGLSINGYKELAMIFPLLFPGLFLLFFHAHQLNLLTFGEEMAAGFGAEVSTIQMHIFIGGCLATASIIAVTGSIGFVGLIVPHAVRRISGYDHRLVLPASFLAGGGFLVLCDTFARTIIAPTEIPVGVITAFIGAPIFLWILAYSQK